MATPRRVRRGAARSLLLIAGLSSLPQARSEGRPAPQGDDGNGPAAAAERVFDSAMGFGPGWQDWGWAPRHVGRGAPALIDFSAHGGWILAKPGLAGPYAGLRFRLRAPLGLGSPLVVHLDASVFDFPHVSVTPTRTRRLEQGWLETSIPMAELNPRGRPFDRIVFRVETDVPTARVEIDQVALLAAGPGDPAPAPVAEAPARAASFALDCAAPSAPISPLIYGIAWKPGHDQFDRHQWLLGASARRLGGNPMSRYNFRLGNAWNAGVDWFFRNVDYTSEAGWSYERFLQDDREHNVRSVLTLPTLGWVAKDAHSYSYPVSIFGAQQHVAPELPDAGNGIDVRGRPIPAGHPWRTSVRSTPADIAEWVSRIRERARKGGPAVDVYVLDNEPMLWSSTHRDVHPEPTSYDELLETTTRYAKAVREADPEATVAAPALWGWPAYFYSAVDVAAGVALRPDRRAHGDEPLLPWWLRKVKEREDQTGARLIDIVDVHFYPQGRGIAGQRAATDAETCERRIRATRALWDPSYRDESWIAEPITLLPRLKSWIAENHPGLGIQIGEYNFGAPEHPSGGLAQAEALGRFASGGVTAAFYWTYPKERSPAFWAFRAFRDFDGRGGRFLDRSLAVSGDAPLASLFASRSEEQDHAVAVLLNHDPALRLNATIASGSCGVIESARVFTYSGGDSGFAALPLEGQQPQRLREVVPPYSITVFDLRFKPHSRPGVAQAARQEDR